MPNQIAWLLEPHVILVVGSGDIGAEEMHTNADLIYDMFESSDAEKVHIITDTRKLKSAPGFQDLRQQKFLSHPRMGWYLTIGVENPVVRFMGSMAGQMSKVSFKFVDDLDEAKAVLKRIDLSIPHDALDRASTDPAQT